MTFYLLSDHYHKREQELEHDLEHELEHEHELQHYHYSKISIIKFHIQSNDLELNSPLEPPNANLLLAVQFWFPLKQYSPLCFIVLYPDLLFSVTFMLP